MNAKNHHYSVRRSLSRIVLTLNLFALVSVTACTKDTTDYRPLSTEMKPSGEMRSFATKTVCIMPTGSYYRTEVDTSLDNVQWTKSITLTGNGKAVGKFANTPNAYSLALYPTQSIVYGEMWKWSSFSTNGSFVATRLVITGPGKSGVYPNVNINQTATGTPFQMTFLQGTVYYKWFFAPI